MANITMDHSKMKGSHPDTSTKLPAKEQVLGTTELLEAIIFTLPTKDISINANKVSRTWHELVTTSVKINKKLMANPSFRIAAKRNQLSNDKSIINLEFFWSHVIIKNLGHMDLIYIVGADRKTSPIKPRFISSDIEISGLTSEERVRLSQRWTSVFSDCLMTGPEDEFLARFELGLYKLVDPKYGAKAQKMFDAYNDPNTSDLLAVPRMPLPLVAHWHRSSIRLEPRLWEEVYRSMLKTGPFYTAAMAEGAETDGT